MRVAIDIRRITEFGVGTYTRNAIRTLARLDHDNEYFLIGIPGKLGDMEPLPPNFITVPAQPNELSVASYLELHRILKQNRCDLLHVPHLFWKPQGIPCPYVVTVHDLLDHLYRVNSHSSLKRNLHFQFTKRVLHRAARIFAVSNFSKTDTERLFHVPAAKIEVIYNAIDDSFRLGPHQRCRTPVHRRALPGERPVSAVCRPHQPAQECGAHHRSLFRAEGRT